MSLTIEDARAEFDRAGLTTVDLNGHGPGFLGLAPCCGGEVTVTLDDTGRVVHNCSNGCDTTRIGHELHFRASVPYTETGVRQVRHAIGVGAGGAPYDDRYAGRIIDVRAILSQPDEPIPWRCEHFAADGYLTVLAGRGGEGKSWLALALACGVARGKPAAGIDCNQGRAVIFDAENGEKLIGRRLRAAGFDPGLAVQPIEAGGLRVLDDLDWFEEIIGEQQANLAVFDSLRVLSSGAKESDGDVMEPIITALKLLARRTGAAVVLIHHRGKGESQYRGSSVILDQTDLLFTLGRVDGDPDGRTRRKIETGKCRIDEEPAPRWVKIEADRVGFVYVNEAEPFEPDEVRPRDGLRDDILDVLGVTPRSARGIAKAVGRRPNDGTVPRVLADLEDYGLARKQPDGWVGGIESHGSVSGLVEATGSITGPEVA